MPSFVVRVWLPDRPGALGAVASRIGAVRGDLIGIEILERGGGRAIDELTVNLPDAGLVDLLVTEMCQVEGVDVEDVRPMPATARDPRLDALETAAILVEQISADDLHHALADHAMHDFDASWSTVVDLDGPLSLASVGVVPPAPWLAAFVAGSRSSLRVAAGECGPDDIAWAALPGADLVVILGRGGRPFRARERHQLAALARIADSRWMELVRRAARSLHPTALV
ncbi:MAG: ACT domain-containing protein [Acidimicrobiales bacterium]